MIKSSDILSHREVAAESSSARPLGPVSSSGDGGFLSTGKSPCMVDRPVWEKFISVALEDGHKETDTNNMLRCGI